jgi:hypothetical protein
VRAWQFGLTLGVVLMTAGGARADDASYCFQLGSLAAKYVGASGIEGRSAPDLHVMGAIEDCRKGRYDKAIPYLEKRLRDSRVTLPPRS